MMSLGAYYAYIVTTEMREAAQARRAPVLPRRPLAARMRAAIASLFARRPATLFARTA